MSDKKFWLNLEDVSFSKYGKKLFFTRKIIFGGTFISLVLGFLFALFFINEIDSPREKTLNNKIQNYQVKYAILNARISDLLARIDELESKDEDIYRIIYELPPLSEDMRLSGVGGTENIELFALSENTKAASTSISNIDKIMRKLNVQSASFDEIQKIAVEKEKMLASLPTIMPVTKERIRLTSVFGWRRNPITKQNFSFHAGVDFAGRVGTPIYATGDGKVENVELSKSGYGNVIIINHGYGYKTLYGHLSRIIVKKGDIIKRGQEIGYMGSTGRSTGSHLHYEVIKRGEKVNPMNYIVSTLTKDEYNEILKQAEELKQ